jgi:uncharacterized membrane protein YhaH (DUF805 family)
MNRFFSFSGTASRSTFWVNSIVGYFLAKLGLVGVFLLVAGGVVSGNWALGLLGVPLALASLVASFVVVFAAGVRRCRDLGHPDWLVALYLVPGLQFAFFLYLGIRPRPEAQSA